jgi:antitoxin (DNA-binding transcriptional repressor) of toxin-antitoxin stability system
VEEVSGSELHARTAATLKRVRTGHVVAVTHYNDVEGYLVPAVRLREMTGRLSELEAQAAEMRSTLPLILAAARAGVALPSETLERVASGLETSWEDLAGFTTQVPVRLTHGQDGAPLARGRLRAAPGPIEESGDDDELNLDA